MLSRVSKQIALQFAVRRIINEEDIEVYEYGINILLTGIVNMVSIIIIGILCGKVIECICFMIMFIPLRQYVGGYHSATPKRCFTCTLMMILIVLSAMAHTVTAIILLLGKTQLWLNIRKQKNN